MIYRQKEMKSITALCLIICLCLATTFADEELVRVKRYTCSGTVERFVGSKACDIHCKIIRKGGGKCRGGTCYCSGRGSQ